jgi:type II restriction/modification system DNA methylase subunit YeeA
MNTLQELQRVDTATLKKFAQAARRKLREQVAAQLDRVIKNDSAELREKETAIKELKNEIATSSRETVIERVSYVWFNRFCALRFMDVNQYTRIGTVSPAEGFTQPEILAEAKQGHIDESLKRFITDQRIFDLLSGRISSKDPQQEAYRLLIVAVCNYYNSIMPFLFEKISDYTELLMPDDLLSDSSILADTRNTLSTETCRDVEVIGWLYQYYISEKKDEVFEDLKKNKKISAQNIPAATQLFTPNWIVRYVVENSLGRLWMLNKPKSRLVDQMDFYVRPEHEEGNFLRVDKPEQLKICDPACGSGHMLVYAFDLLYAIYEEEGYEVTDIPSLILENNLFGIEIDERAGELAAFALTMKARNKYRRFFNKPVQPNICVLEAVEFDQKELAPYLETIGSNLFTENLENTLHQFRHSENFGSLIRPTATNVATIRDQLDHKNVSANLFLHKTHENVSRALKYADFLSSKYHVVIANPPYMGAKGMNDHLKTFLQDHFPHTKSDLFAAFIIRIMQLTMNGGFMGVMTPFNWMFLSTFEKLRQTMLKECTLTNLVRPEFHAFFDSAYVSICAFTLFKRALPSFKGTFIDLDQFYGSDIQPLKALEAIQNPQCGWLYKVSSDDLQHIPGKPIAYWCSPRIREIFAKAPSFEKFAKPKLGMRTGENERFVRYWYEVSKADTGFGFNSAAEAKASKLRWFPYNKGGMYRKWYGNNDFVVNWHNDGYEIKSSTLKRYPQLTWENLGWKISNESDFFKPSLEWSRISSSYLGVRYSPSGFLFDTNGSSAFPSERDIYWLLGYLCSKVTATFVQMINPTMAFQPGDLALLPVVPIDSDQHRVTELIKNAIEISKIDWDMYETSWDFRGSPLLTDKTVTSLRQAYDAARSYSRDLVSQMDALEKENNTIFIAANGLQKELSPEVPLTEITLNCNPWVRYGEKPPEELETAFFADTIKEYISYSVGCMFGRYSLDKPGLVLANQGQTKQDFLAQVPSPTFPIDDDNVIPILDGDWFNDDITERFRKFLRVCFGDAHYQENIQLVENALGKDLRKYFLKDFYNDHIKRYKKRPIYWLFSSPKGTFNALIYLHRYRPDTVSVVLNDYLREFRNKLSARKNHLETVTISANVGTTEKTKALKEIESLKKAIDELDTYEREVLYPLATQKIQIDLGDGVKVNYSKFGRALKAIPGMATEEE